MINFRFHLVSLVAVFLALAVGIVLGATVVQRAVVDTLNNRIESVSKKADTRRKENDDLRAQVDQKGSFIDQISQFAVTGRLPRVPVVVFAIEGVDAATVKAQVQLIQTAGGVTPGILWLEDAWAMKNGDADRLARTLGLPARADHNALRDDVWKAITARLAAGQSSLPDPLSALLDQKFLRYEGVGDQSGLNLLAFPGGGARVVLIGGTDADVEPGPLVASAAKAITTAGLPVDAGEVYVPKQGGLDRGAILAPVRAAQAAAGLLSTVDDLDLAEGRVTTVLALAGLGRQPPVVGEYGKDHKLPASAGP